MNPRMRHAWCFAALLIVLWLSSCVEVKEVKLPTSAQTSTAKANALVAHEDHDVQILAVDFTLPESRTTSQATQVQLGIAVENKGYYEETDLTLTVVLRDDKGRLVTQFIQAIPKLAPGEITIPTVNSTVRQLDSTRYHLQVRISAVSGETNLANNNKSYDLQIDQAK